MSKRGVARNVYKRAMVPWGPGPEDTVLLMAILGHSCRHGGPRTRSWWSDQDSVGLEARGHRTKAATRGTWGTAWGSQNQSGMVVVLGPRLTKCTYLNEGQCT